MKIHGYKLITLITLICLIFSMTVTCAFAEDSGAEVMNLQEGLLDMENDKTEETTPESSSGTLNLRESVKLVVPDAEINAIPDNIYDANNPLVDFIARFCYVSASAIYNLAKCANMQNKDVFYIDASHAGENIYQTSVEIEAGIYPVNDSGKRADFGILTNAGYLYIGASAACTLLDENTYKSIEIETVKYNSDNTYRISFTGTKLDGEKEKIVKLPENSTTFTVWPDDSFVGKTVTYARRDQLRYGGICTWNDDGTMTFSVTGHGDYKLKLYKEPGVKVIPNHTLEIVSDGYGNGYVNMDADNCYVPVALNGSYLENVIINGVSKGAVSKITFSEGDQIIVIFAKLEENAETNEYDGTAKAEAAKLEKLKSGVRNTTIKASTVEGVKKGVKITWKKSKGYAVDEYEIWRSIKKTSGYKKTFTTADGTKTSYTNTKTLKGIRYYYRVRGVRTIGGEKVYTKWSNRCYRIAK